MKKVFTKAIAIVLCAIMIFGAAPAGMLAQADWGLPGGSRIGRAAQSVANLFDGLSTKASAAKKGDYTYTVRDGKATITGFNSEVSGVITIPSTLGGCPVVSIGDGAFCDCDALTSVIIPNSVTSIEDDAFRNCEALTSVTIPDSVTSIDGGAFQECTAMTSVTIPDSVTSIGDSAFHDCKALASITIGDSVTSMGWDAFHYTAYYYNESNRDSDGVLYIGKYLIEAKKNISGSYIIKDGTLLICNGAFQDCKALTSAAIPNSVTNIGYSVFLGCTALMGITVAGDNAGYSNDSFGVLFNKDKSVLIQYPAGNTRTDYTVPASVTRIGYGAFRDSAALASVIIPDSVTSIGEEAFCDCTALASVVIPDSVTSIGEEAFCDCTALASITLPDSVARIGSNAFDDTAYFENESNWDGNGVLYIGEYLIRAKEDINECRELKDGTRVICDGAFFNCWLIWEAIIPDSVESIGKSAFFYCLELRSVTIGNSVTSIGEDAFADCTALTSVTIPDSVTSIGEGAFAVCIALKSVTVPDSVTIISDWAFADCTALTSVTIGNSVTSIGEFAFADCTKLSSITLPKSVRYLGDGAFRDCMGLVYVHISSKDIEIGEDIFYGYCSARICSQHLGGDAAKYAIKNNIPFFLCLGHGSLTKPFVKILSYITMLVNVCLHDVTIIFDKLKSLVNI